MKKARWSWLWYIVLEFRWFPYIKKYNLGWKEKFGSPRVSDEPRIIIEFLWFGLSGIKGTDDYWEQWLWLYRYCDGNLKKAKESWNWIDDETKKSTWKDEYEK